MDPYMKTIIHAHNAWLWHSSLRPDQSFWSKFKFLACACLCFVWLRQLAMACGGLRLIWACSNFIASFFQLAKTCELFEHKLSRWKSLVSKLNMATSDEVDVVLNKSNNHSESSKAKPAKAKWKGKKKWPNSEIHKLIEEARTCFWDTFSIDYHKKSIM